TAPGKAEHAVSASHGRVHTLHRQVSSLPQVSESPSVLHSLRKCVSPPVEPPLACWHPSRPSSRPIQTRRQLAGLRLPPEARLEPPPAVPALGAGASGALAHLLRAARASVVLLIVFMYHALANVDDDATMRTW